MRAKTIKIMASLPPENEQDLLPLIRDRFVRSKKTLVVLDDDPTGTQTCYDVVVLTSWSVALLVEELRKHPSILFILTNSRSMPERLAVKLSEEIGDNLTKAVKESERDIAVISRSDSTLRGHYPAEVEAIARALNMHGAITVLVPAFIEGGRVTIGDTHYILEQDELVPVADTAFARDTVFGYTHSDLKDWVEEKTKGKVRASQVISLSLQDIRVGGPETVADKLGQCGPGEVCIVNACSNKDLQVVVMGLILAEGKGQKFIYRTSATFVPIRAGTAPGKTVIPAKNKDHSANGSLVVVGSYVPKTTRQLEHLLNQSLHHSIEVNVPQLLRGEATDAYASAIKRETNQLLSSGKDVVIHTSRQLETGVDTESNLRINKTVSSFLVDIVQGLNVRPSFIIAKGGITSSDLATKGLGAEKALILGQILPGVPVWKMDAKSKFPDITYVVFPGNVGNDAALTEVCNMLATNSAKG